MLIDNSEELKSKENDEVDRIVKEELTDEFCQNFIEVRKDIWMPETYRKFAKDIKEFEVRDSDVIVASFPKSGTTWTQEMAWLIGHDLDYKAAEVDLGLRFPFLEFCSLYDYEKMNQVLRTKIPEQTSKSIEFVKSLKGPRFIKTHLPFSILPDQIRNGSKSPKIIYVTRNPKDVCVSFLHHGRLFRRWKANIEKFSKVFLANKAMYGSYWNHVFGYWAQRSSPNFLHVRYEDMKKDLPSVIKAVSAFLNKTLTAEQVEALCNHLSFESMKNNKAVNDHDRIEARKKLNLVTEEGAFMRSGTIGKYKEEMSAETVGRFDKWIKDNLEGTDFGLHYNFSL